MVKVFISYSRSNGDIAIDLRKAFQDNGVDVWMDVFDIPAGCNNWDRLIHYALRECTHLVLLHTSSSFASDEVWSEWRDFLARDKPVIPLILENTELPFRLRSVQCIDCLNQSLYEAFQQLLDAILVWFPTPPDWTGSPELLPLPTNDNQHSFRLPSGFSEDDYRDELLRSLFSGRISWNKCLRQKQEFQSQLQSFFILMEGTETLDFVWWEAACPTGWIPQNQFEGERKGKSRRISWSPLIVIDVCSNDLSILARTYRIVDLATLMSSQSMQGVPIELYVEELVDGHYPLHHLTKLNHGDGVF